MKIIIHVFFVLAGILSCVISNAGETVSLADCNKLITDTFLEIRWVNDIYAGRKKLCGILTEAWVNVERGGLEYAIVGIGVNVQNVTFPKNIADIATSVKLESNKHISRGELVAEILNCLEERLETIRDKSFLDEYRKRSNVIGRRIEVTHNENAAEMDCTGIDEIGRLIVRTDDGEEKAIMSGTVRIVE